MTISEAQTYRGHRVQYTPGHARGSVGHPDLEFGTINSVNDVNIFVKFDKQVQKLGYEGTTAQCCSPEDLTLL